MPFDLALDLLCSNLTGERFLLDEVSPGLFELWIGDVVRRGWEWN